MSPRPTSTTFGQGRSPREAGERAQRRRQMILREQEAEQRRAAEIRDTQLRLREAFYARNPHLRSDAA